MRRLLLLSSCCLASLCGLARPVAAGEVFTFFEPPASPQFIEMIASSNKIDGVAIPLIWSEIEIEKGKYDWEPLDSLVEPLIRNNKKITLNIISRYAGTVPDWVVEDATETITYTEKGVTQKFLLPWSPTLTDHYIDFIKALSRHMVDKNYTPSLAYVGQSVNMTAKTEVPGCSNGYVDNAKFEYAALVVSVTQRLNALLDAFPTSIIQLEAPPVDVCGGDKKGSIFLSDVMGGIGARTGRIMLLTPDLSARASERLFAAKKQIKDMKVGARFIWSYDNDKKNFFGGSFASAACLGAVGYNASYFEVFLQDFYDENDDIFDPLRAIRKNNLSFCDKATVKKEAKATAP